MDYGEDRVVINVSGLRFETYLSTLERYPDTLLGCHSRRSIYYDSFKREYFFNRNRRVFDAILFYYQSDGRIAKPADISEKHFLKELSFFKIGEEKELLTFAERVDKCLIGETPQIPSNKIQRFIWKLFTNPDASIGARFVTFLGIFTLTLSIVISCVESLPNLQRPKTKIDQITKKVIVISNHTCYVWFTIELAFRLSSTVKKLEFFKSILNIIDLAAILPYYIELIIKSNTKMTHLSMLRVFRLFRIARLLKFSRYSRGIRALLFTLYASRHELSLMCFLIVISTVLSGALTYFAEIHDENTFMTSIPESLWWSINTITTVGYGDTYPITVLGKSIGGFFSMFGTILLGLPIFCLVSKFIELWDSIKEMSFEEQDKADQTSSQKINRDGSPSKIETEVRLVEGQSKKICPCLRK